jgi:hypothetical protein
MSNKEQGEPLEKKSSLDEPSSMAIARLKIEIACTCYNIIDAFCL